MLRDLDRQRSWLRPARVVALIGAAGLGLLALALALSSGQAPFALRHEAGATAASRQADPPTETTQRPLSGADPDDAAAAHAHRAALPAETAALSAEAARLRAAVAAETVRVVVLHRANSVTAEHRAAATGGAVREVGFELAAIRPVGSVPAARVVRCFHASDAAAAARLAGRLGPGWAIQDFRALSPSPPPQTLELWLLDR